MTQVAPHSSRSGGRESGRESGRERPHGPGRESRPARPESPDADDDAFADGTEARGRHATTYGQGFGGVVLWTVLGSFVPGVGLIIADRRKLGSVVLAINGLLAVGLGVALYRGGLNGIITFAASPSRIVIAATVLLVLVLLWALVVLGTHASLRRYAHLTLQQRVLSSALVVAIVALVLIPAARAADYSLIYKDASSSIFAGDADGTTGKGPNVAKADPWADTPRVNVLMLGSDAGANREGVRTDTVIVASIDTKTGRTVLFSLPRNLQGVPFPPGSPQAADYPDGYRCADGGCMLNALWQFGVEHRARYYPGAKSDWSAGYTAIRQGAEQTLGLSIDTYAVVDMKGLQQFIDAVGGVTVPVLQELAIGGAHDGSGRVTQNPKAYIQPGIQQLDGYKAMWYARSRFNTDDYNRMARQRCLIGYVLDQTDPMDVLRSFPGIAKAAKGNIKTGIPIDQLSAWADLALRVQSGGVSSLSFTSKVLGSTTNPRYDFIQEKVQDAITAPVKAAPRPAAPSSGAGATRTPRPAPSPSAEVPNGEAANLKDVCAPVP